MSVAIEQQSECELYQHLTGNIVEEFLEGLSAKLGRGERVFWALVAISKGDAKAPEKLKLGDSSLNTIELAEELMAAILVHSRNQRLSQDIWAGKVFLELINREKNNKR